MQWNEYLIADGEMIGVRFNNVTTATVTLRYYHKDHLGSVATLTDGTPGSPTFGAVVERDSFDSWGKRRFATGADDPTGSLASQTTRGYTGQEELADVGLVHMNGRVYDPTLGRFTSADPTVQHPFSTQGWNRYAYVGNNPLAFTDPDGYGFFSFIGSVLNNLFNPVQTANDIVSVIRAVESVPYLGTAINIASIAIAAEACGPCAIGVAAANASIMAGVNGGSLTQALEAGTIAAAEAAAFQAVGAATNGDFTDVNQYAEDPEIASTPSGYMVNAAGQSPDAYIGTPDFFANVAGHMAIGCASAAASGGGCGANAVAAGFSAAAGPSLVTMGFAQGLVASSVVGGVGSVAGGGKFENGAVTASFGYLFNGAASQLALNNAVGKIGEYLRVFQLELEGYDVTTQILYQDPGTQSKSFVDITAYRDEPVSETTDLRRYLFEEIKTGGGQVKVNQQAVMDAIANGTAIPLGPRVTFAKLIPGVPLRDQLQNYTAVPRPGSQ